MRRTHAQLEAALTERLAVEEERERMLTLEALAVCLIVDSEEIVCCDVCHRNECTPLYDNPHAQLLNMYLFEPGDRPEYWNTCCEDCVETLLAEWED